MKTETHDLEKDFMGLPLIEHPFTMDKALGDNLRKIGVSGYQGKPDAIMVSKEGQSKELW